MRNNILKHPLRYAIAYLQNKGVLDWMPDTMYCSAIVYSRCGYFVNYRNPSTFNEKMQWLKRFYRVPDFTNMVDKIKAKSIVKCKVPELHVAKTLRIYASPEQISLDDLPEQFVLKCNHDGGVIICRNKSDFDLESAKRVLSNRLKIDYYKHGREWPYTGIDRRIFAEEFLSDDEHNNLPVYKFLCFNGTPKIIQTIQNDKTQYETIDYFDLDWNLLELRQNYPNSNHPADRPIVLSEMLEYAKSLSRGYPFLRVDFFVVNDLVYFSEFTFYSDAGFEPFVPKEWDKKLGEMIDLPDKHQ